MRPKLFSILDFLVRALKLENIISDLIFNLNKDNNEKGFE